MIDHCTLYFGSSEADVDVSRPDVMPDVMFASAVT